MDITQSQIDKHSENEFSRRFSILVDSGVGIIHVRTNEVLRALVAIRKQAIVDNGIVREWDIVNGFRNITNDTVTSMLLTGDGNVDISSAFAVPLETLRSSSCDEMQYFVYTNPHIFFDGNPVLTQLLLTYSHALPSTNIVVVLVTPDAPLPNEVESTIMSLPFAPPGLAELRESITGILQGVEGNFDGGLAYSDSDVDSICYAGSGMSKNLFEMYAALAIVQAARDGKETVTPKDIVDGVALGKTDIVNSNDILELYQSASMDNVGGLENLKAWVARRKDCYSDAAKDFGIEPPKGLVLVGVPGSGKSLIAKSIASELGVQLVRLDFGRVFNSLVGASEGRMRTALKMVEAMAPIVLFCDEIDKGLGGIGGSGDSGTSSRVLGSFLTWLNDCKAPVFTIVTANNVTGLPPEMLRRGRFDAIFSTSLPTPRERREVLRIHLKLRGRNIKEFAAADIAGVINASEGYVPAEIESAVKDALVDAFSEGVEMTTEHILAALTAMVPLSKAFGPQIAAMNEWAQANATPAGIDSQPAAPERGMRRIGIRTPRKGE